MGFRESHKREGWGEEEQGRERERHVGHSEGAKRQRLDAPCRPHTHHSQQTQGQKQVVTQRYSGQRHSEYTQKKHLVGGWCFRIQVKKIRKR